MAIIEKNEDEDYVVTISLSELISVIFLLYYAYNFVKFIGEHHFK
tara:strand:+ start:82 stop:216 length:135 start_codon:yes stop_codon:yes gene_type:complete